MESNEIDFVEWLDSFEEDGHSTLIQVKKYKDAIYIGQVQEKNGKFFRHGKGIMIYQNGRKYEGEWLDDLRNGRGFEKYANGNLYTGSFKDGKANGHGNYKWENGE